MRNFGAGNDSNYDRYIRSSTLGSPKTGVECGHPDCMQTLTLVIALAGFWIGVLVSIEITREKYLNFADIDNHCDFCCLIL
jgi:hypothetical protein